VIFKGNFYICHRREWGVTVSLWLVVMGEEKWGKVGRKKSLLRRCTKKLTPLWAVHEFGAAPGGGGRGYFCRTLRKLLLRDRNIGGGAKPEKGGGAFSASVGRGRVSRGQVLMRLSEGGGRKKKKKLGGGERKPELLLKRLFHP